MPSQMQRLLSDRYALPLCLQFLPLRERLLCRRICRQWKFAVNEQIGGPVELELQSQDRWECIPTIWTRRLTSLILPIIHTPSRHSFLLSQPTDNIPRDSIIPLTSNALTECTNLTHLQFDTIGEEAADTGLWGLWRPMIEIQLHQGKFESNDGISNLRSIRVHRVTPLGSQLLSHENWVRLHSFEFDNTESADGIQSYWPRVLESMVQLRRLIFRPSHILNLERMQQYQRAITHMQHLHTLYWNIPLQPTWSIPPSITDLDLMIYPINEAFEAIQHASSTLKRLTLRIRRAMPSGEDMLHRPEFTTSMESLSLNLSERISLEMICIDSLDAIWSTVRMRKYFAPLLQAKSPFRCTKLIMDAICGSTSLVSEDCILDLTFQSITWERKERGNQQPYDVRNDSRGQSESTTQLPPDLMNPTATSFIQQLNSAQIPLEHIYSLHLQLNLRHNLWLILELLSHLCPHLTEFKFALTRSFERCAHSTKGNHLSSSAVTPPQQATERLKMTLGENEWNDEPASVLLKFPALSHLAMAVISIPLIPFIPMLAQSRSLKQFDYYRSYVQGINICTPYPIPHAPPCDGYKISPGVEPMVRLMQNCPFSCSLDGIFVKQVLVPKEKKNRCCIQ